MRSVGGVRYETFALSGPMLNQVTESALVNLLTAQLELQCTELARPGGCLRGVGTTAPSAYTPPASANQRRFFNDFSKA